MSIYCKSLILSGLLAIIHLQAQNTRNLQFTIYSQSPIRELAYHAQPSKNQSSKHCKQLTQLQHHPLEAVGPYAFRGSATINFYHLHTHAHQAQVDIPSNSDQWLFIFTDNPHFPNHANTLPYRIYPIDTSLLHWPKNSLIFLNLSGMRLAGRLNQQYSLLGPGESRAYPIAATTRVQLRSYDAHKIWRTAWLKTITTKPERQHLILLFPPVLSGSNALDARVIIQPML
jgi:hypothetical protein